MVLTYDPFGGMIKPPLDLGEIDAAMINGIPNYDLHGDLYFNEVSEITFTSPMFYTDRMGDYVKSAVYDKLDLYRKVKLSGFGTFEIVECNEVTDGVSWVKNITAKSAENEFTRKKVTFEINQGTETSLDGVKLFDDNDTEHSLMHIVMKKLPHWGYGHIDPTIRTRERSFDVEDRDVYSFLQEDVAKAFGIFFTFDTDRELINIYAAEDVGEDTDVYITAENLAESIDATANTDDIVTKVRVQGDDTDVTVREYNLGQEYIVDISYFLDNKYMPQELVDKYKKWQELFESKRSVYEGLLTDYNAAQEEWLNIYNKQPESTDSKNWSEYGMAGLLSLKAQYENSVSVEIDAGHGSADSIYHDRYLEYYNALNAIKAEIEIRQAELDTQQSKIDTISQQMAEIANEVAMENNFTEDEVDFLSRFEYEGEYSDDAFLITDDESIESITETKRALYEEATKWLHNVARPQYSFTMDLGNLLAIPEFAPIREKFALGNYILIEMRPGYITKARINRVSINFEDFSDFSVEFGSLYNMKDNVDKVADALDKVNTSSNTVSAESSEWQKATDASRKFMELYQTGLNASLIQIKNNDNEEVLINHMGIKLQKKDPDTLVYDNHVVMLTSTGIYFSDDNLASLKAALGEVTYEDQTFYGLIAEAVVSGIVKSSIIYASEIHSGYLGKHGWTIGEDAIYNGKDAFDSKEWGMYIGRDEINAYDTFKIDRNGRVTIEVTSLSITGKGGTDSSFDDYLNESVDNARTLLVQLSNIYQGIPTDSNGFYSTFPTCETVVSVFWGSIDATDGATYEIETSSGVTGNWDVTNKKYSVTGITEDSNWVDIRATYQGLTAVQRFDIVKQRQGQKGDIGLPGADGTSTYFHVKYSSVPNPSADQMTETPSKYIGTYVDSTPEDSNDPNDYDWVQLEGTDGIPGKNGVDGKTSYLHIKYSNDGGTSFTSNNGEDPGDYIGQYVDFIEADSSTPSDYTWSKTRGEDGIPGKDGVDGKTTYFHVKYSSKPNPTSSSDITETPSAYIGTYVDYTEADSMDPSMYTWSKFQGTDGIPGTNGTNGETSYLHIKYSNDGGMTFTSNNGEDPGDYIGQYVDFEQTDSYLVSDYTWSKVKGDDGESYSVTVSSAVIKQVENNNFSPSSVRFYATKSVGASAPEAFNGYFRIYESTDGSYYNLRYSSSASESETNYSPFSAYATNIRCELYDSSSFTNLLDRASVSVVRDVSNLTPEEMFDKLTEGGVKQGMFISENGKVYFNGEYIKSFIISADELYGGIIKSTNFSDATPYARKGMRIVLHSDTLGDSYDGEIKTTGFYSNGDGEVYLNDLYLKETAKIYQNDISSYATFLRATVGPSGHTLQLGLVDAVGDAANYVKPYMTFTDGRSNSEVYMQAGEFRVSGTIYSEDSLESVQVTATNAFFSGIWGTGATGVSLAYKSGQNSYAINVRSGGLIPSTGNLLDLGSSSAPWDTLYCGKINKLTLPDDNTSGNILYSYDGEVTAFGYNPTYNWLEVTSINGTRAIETSQSDSRLKADIDISNVYALPVINQIKHRKYRWKNNGALRTNGYIAQELEKINPDFVIKVQQPESSEMDYLYQVSYYNIIPYITKAIQEFYSMYTEKISELEEKLEKLEERLNGQTN